jgi:hypothetical protein
MSKAELKQRLSFIKHGQWDETILYFADGREVWAITVTARTDGTVLMTGRDCSTGKHVTEPIDPLTVVRTAH